MVRPQGGFSSRPGPGCRHEHGDRKKRMEKHHTVEIERTWWLGVDREKESSRQPRVFTPRVQVARETTTV